MAGEKRAFMAEPSARPAINDRLDERRRCKNEEEKKTKKTTKKIGEKELNFVFPTGSENFSPAGRSCHDEMIRW